MSGSALKTTKPKAPPASTEVQLAPLLALLDDQDAAMRSLFAKALNIYVSPGADATPDNEKLDQLKRAIEEPPTDAAPIC